MNQSDPTLNQQPALFIGIDWADRAHDVYIIDEERKGKHETLEQSPEAINDWIERMRRRAGERPIAIILEQARGPLVHALMFRPGVQIYPINPKQFARYGAEWGQRGRMGSGPNGVSALQVGLPWRREGPHATQSPSCAYHRLPAVCPTENALSPKRSQSHFLPRGKQNVALRSAKVAF